MPGVTTRAPSVATRPPNWQANNHEEVGRVLAGLREVARTKPEWVLSNRPRTGRPPSSVQEDPHHGFMVLGVRCVWASPGQGFENAGSEDRELDDDDARWRCRAELVDRIVVIETAGRGGRTWALAPGAWSRC